MSNVTPITEAMNEEKSKMKSKALDGSRAQQAEMDKHLDNVNQKSDKAADHAEAFADNAQAVIKAQAAFRNEKAADFKETIKEQALAEAVMGIEHIDAAIQSLKSARGDILSRIHSTFEYQRADVNRLIKERMFPKAQLELELNLQRTQMGVLHTICEKHGAPRVDTEKTNNGKSKKAA